MRQSNVLPAKNPEKVLDFEQGGNPTVEYSVFRPVQPIHTWNVHNAGVKGKKCMRMESISWQALFSM